MESPVAIVNCGVPVTKTFSLKVTVKGILSPMLYRPSFSDDDTFATVGCRPSMIRALLADKELLCPGIGRDSDTSFPAMSCKVPLFNANEDVDV